MTECKPLQWRCAADFDLVRSEGVYVDKSALVAKLASRNNGAYLLLRPRCFGLSLLVSTFESLFKNGTATFKGLDAEKLWKDEKKYKVVTLPFNFLKVTSPENIDKEMLSIFRSSFLDAGMDFTSKVDPDDWASCLRETLAKEEKNSVVILVEEFDAPLTHRIGRPDEFRLVRGKLDAFLEILKTPHRREKIRFMLVTASVHFAPQTGPTPLIDISLNPTYGAITGFTEFEVEKYFADYIAKAEKLYGLTHAEFMKKLRDNYGGFCFDRAASTLVYSPRLVLDFFRDLPTGEEAERNFKPEQSEFDCYWTSGGGMLTVIYEYFKMHGVRSIFGDTLITMASGPYEVGMSPESFRSEELFTHTGYLTIKEAGDGVFRVGFPNRDVQRAYKGFMESQQERLARRR